MNTSITNPPNTQDGNQYSLQSVATHEIDEVLGIGGSGSTIGGGLSGVAVGDLDLFRYAGLGARSYTTDSTATSYFSIDGGATVLSYFNQQGGGSDYADWASDPLPQGFGPQVQDAYSSPGVSPTLGTSELTAFNAIGYSVQSVPEPSSILMVGIGLTLTAWKLRPRESAKTPAPV